MTDFRIREMLETDLPVLFDIQADARAQLMATFADTSNDREKYLRKWRMLLVDDSVLKTLERVPVRPVLARAAHDNIASIRVLERNGFIRVGEQESFAQARGSHIKEVVFRLS